MELDKKVYDKEDLAEALIQQLNAESPTFKANYPSDTATALVNVLAAYGAMLNYFFVSTMANCYTDSAFSDSGIRQLAKTLGNTLHGNEPAQTFVTIKKNNLQAKDISIPAYSSFTINNKKFFNPSAVILPATNPIVTQVPLIQGEIVKVDKVTSGVAGEKLYFSSDYKASMNYTTVVVGESEWETTDSFLPYDKNYVEDTSEMDKVILETEADGRCYIKFGDGTLGTLPASGTAVTIKYVSNDGELGNVPQINLACTLTTPLVYINSLNNQEVLNITAYTTSTIYGGYGKQSIETLRLTSPYVFASGHRAIRRNDYVSLLQNQCGYLTSSVWGEYEQSQYKGAYDALMMNMVYYSGIKSYENYADYEIGVLESSTAFTSASNTTRAFWGTYALKIINQVNADKQIEVVDSGAKGVLFINDDTLDGRDSLLDPWTAETIKLHTNDDTTFVGYSSINNARSDKESSSKYCSDGSTISLLTPKQILIDCHNSPKTLAAVKFKTDGSDKPFIGAFSIYGTNSTVGEITGEWWKNSLFINIRNSMNWDNLTGRVNPEYPEANKWTEWVPTTLALDLNADLSYKTYNYYVIEVYDTTNEVGLTESELVINKIKGLFIDDASTINYNDNGKINMKFPKVGDSGTSGYYKVTNTTISDNGEDYAVGDILKILDVIDESVIDTSLRIKVTTVNSDGGITGFTWVDDFNYYPKDGNVQYDGTRALSTAAVNASCVGTGAKLKLTSVYSTKLVKDLIGSSDYPLYYYVPEYAGITRLNGYKTGNNLLYSYTDTETSKDTTFVVNVENIDTGKFTTCLATKTPVSVTLQGTALNYNILDYSFNSASNLILAGNSYILMSEPASLDDTIIYEFTSTILDKDSESSDNGYSVGDILKVMVPTNTAGTAYGDCGAKIVVDNVSAGSITAFHWLTPHSTTGALNGIKAKTEPADGSTGTGFVFTVKTQCLSGTTYGTGSGATINVISNNNLVVTASFTGNRIDTNDINKVDQPIINKYNHFTTYTEFVQPEARPVAISLDVSLDTSSSRSSGIIIQEIKNAISSLFEITPDFLGSGLKISDIYTKVMEVPSVNWCLVTSPVNNIEVEQNKLLTLKNITVNEIIKEFK